MPRPARMTTRAMKTEAEVVAWLMVGAVSLTIWSMRFSLGVSFARMREARPHASVLRGPFLVCAAGWAASDKTADVVAPLVHHQFYAQITAWSIPHKCFL